VARIDTANIAADGRKEQPENAAMEAIPCHRAEICDIQQCSLSHRATQVKAC
jgi:hypothetical protein